MYSNYFTCTQIINKLLSGEFGTKCFFFFKFKFTLYFVFINEYKNKIGWRIEKVKIH